jgi:hypothetical protein
MTTEKTADPAKKDQGLQYDSVKAWDAGIGEMDRTRAVVFVPRAEVRSLELAYISGAERPLIAILLGVVVLAVSVSPVLYLLAVLALGGQMDVKLFFILGFAPLGLWLFRFALRKRLVLVVHTAQDRRKMVFQGSSDLNAARDFVDRIGSRYGYPVALGETLRSFRNPPA